MSEPIEPAALEDVAEATAWEAYFWPGSLVLRNRFGLYDEEQLRDREYRETTKRDLELRTGSVEIPRTGDITELRRIHAHLFGSVYDWAGRYRTVGLTKNRKSFLAPPHFDRYAARVNHDLAAIDWTALDHPQFIDRTAHSFMLLNYMHPFREGNGRAVRLFMDRRAEDSRFTLDYGRVKPNQWHFAFQFAMPEHDQRYPTDHTYLVMLFKQIAVPKEIGAATTTASSVARKHRPAVDRTTEASGIETHAAVEAAGLHTLKPASTLDSTDSDTAVHLRDLAAEPAPSADTAL
ncbi:Fic/DOC family protein [Nocardia carnea]|uniref:Fic/DOC family protein n=1 Tax=Nocardia carnea TaxID=37328 RepID=UPI0024550427|nr:Fic family protein [Nocardia carnea]